MQIIYFNIKKPRVDIRGYIHIQDYIDYYDLDIRRFIPNVTILEKHDETVLPLCVKNKMDTIDKKHYS